MAKTTPPKSSTPKSSTPKPAPSPPSIVDKKTEKVFDQIARDQKELVLGFKDLLELSDELEGVWDDFAKAITNVAKNSSKLEEHFDELQDYTKSIYSNLENIGEEYYEHLDIGKKLTDQQEKRNKLDTQQLNINSEIEDKVRQYNKALQSGLPLVAEKLKTQLDELSTAQAVGAAELERAKIYEEQLVALDASNKMLETANKHAKKYGISMSEVTKEIMSPFEKVTDFVKEMPGGGMLSKFLGLDKGMEKLEKKVMASFVSNLANTGSVGKSAFKALMTGARGFMASIAPLLPIIITIGAIFEAFKMALEVDKETMTLARNLGMSSEAAHELHHEMQSMVLDTENGAMAMEDLDKAAIQLSKTFGTNAALSKDMLENQVALTKNLGVSEESAAELNRMFKTQGGSLKDNTLEVMSTIQAYNKATGAAFNQNEVMEDIAKVSKRIQLQFKGNFKALSLQVMKAKQLGLSLDQIDKMGRQSLDIESSIGAEMEARVLTGKNINLNAFRLAALHKDQAGMMNEIQKYAGNAAEFSKMDYIQQEALAKAFGMSSDEMADMLAKKEMFAKLNVKEIDELTEQKIQNSNLTEEQKKQLEQELLRATAQERMLHAQEGLNETLKQMAASLQPIISAFSKLISHATSLKIIISLLVGLMVAMAAASIATAIGATLGAGAFAIIGGLAAAGTGLAMFLSSGEEAADKATKKVDDSAMAPVGPSGYSRILSGPKGSVAINDEDHIVTGTNLKGNASSGGNAEVISLLKQLVQKVDQPVQFVIGGKVINELDRTLAIRKSYTGKVDQGYGAFG